MSLSKPLTLRHLCHLLNNILGLFYHRHIVFFTISLVKNTKWRQNAATRRSNKFHRANKIILLKILSPRQNFVVATGCTKSNWFDFFRRFQSEKRGLSRVKKLKAFSPVMVKAVVKKAQGGEDRFPTGPRALLSYFQSRRKRIRKL